MPPHIMGPRSADLAFLFLTVLIPVPHSLDTTGYPQLIISVQWTQISEPGPQLPAVTPAAAASELRDTWDWKVQLSALF